MKEKILKILGEENEDILNYTGENMMKEGVIDSFEVIDIVSELEEAFNIEIDAKYVIPANFANKETIIALVEKLIGE